MKKRIIIQGGNSSGAIKNNDRLLKI